MNSDSVNSIFGSFTVDLGSMIADNLPLVMVISAALIGLGIVVRYVKRWIGWHSEPSFFGKKMLSRSEWSARGGASYKGSMFK